MSVNAPEQQSSSVIRAGGEEEGPVSAAEIDRSCRVPVTLLFFASLKWLVLGGVLGVITSIKLHAAGFLADSAFLTYGRVRPAFFNVLIFGFAAQAGLAAALWMLARLGRNRLQGAFVITVATVVWNLGLALGVVGILAGDGTGYELLELPRYATPILFFAYLLIGIAALLTFHARREGELYPSQWYILGALLWFPWVYSTAQLLLVFGSVRGVLQPVVAGWAGHNLISLWLTPLGLAASFYFLPKLAHRPLHSRSLAIFGFWTLALFGAIGGVPSGTPAPRWIAAVSVAGTVLSLVAVLAVVTNLYQTLAGAGGTGKGNPAYRFFLVGACSYLIASVLKIVGEHAAFSDRLHFTLFEPGVMQLFLYGFAGMTLCGAMYYIVPRITGGEWPSVALLNFHFWAGTIGVLLVAAPLVVGGFLQGNRLGNAAISFIDVVRLTKPFLGTSTLGGVMILAGFGAMLLNMVRMICSCCCSGCDWKNWMAVDDHSARGGKRA